MPLDLTFGDLRKLIEAESLGWQPRPDIPDYVRLPKYALGASKEGLVPTEKVPSFDLKKLGAGSNPFLAVRRVERQLISADEVRDAFSTPFLKRIGLDEALEAATPEGGTPPAPPNAGTPPSPLDWRNRWGQNWITSVRDQNPCNACWAFAGTALVEAMVRIEHSMWTRLSEGDVHRGVGKTCPDLGNLGEVSTFFANNGICDPGSWPWRTDSPPYAPTPDRNGRSVRGPAFDLTSVSNSKNWLDTVGPLITWIDVYNDFSGVNAGVYHRSTSPANAIRGGHFMLIVGYDDSLQAWLCKNSWGTGWGVNGYGWIGYGECNIDKYGRYGVRNTNPDPWTKRRLHKGNLIESGNGALHRNLEVAGSDGSRVLHRWREGGPPWTWGTSSSFASDAAVCPTLISTTFNRNMEIVYLTSSGRLHHWWTPEGAGRGTTAASSARRAATAFRDSSRATTTRPAISRSSSPSPKAGSNTSGATAAAGTTVRCLAAPSPDRERRSCKGPMEVRIRTSSAWPSATTARCSTSGATSRRSPGWKGRSSAQASPRCR